MKREIMQHVASSVQVALENTIIHTYLKMIVAVEMPENCMCTVQHGTPLIFDSSSALCGEKVTEATKKTKKGKAPEDPLMHNSNAIGTSAA